MYYPSILVHGDHAAATEEVSKHLKSLGYPIAGTQAGAPVPGQKPSRATGEVVVYDRRAAPAEGLLDADALFGGSDRPLVVLTAAAGAVRQPSAATEPHCRVVVWPAKDHELSAAIEAVRL